MKLTFLGTGTSTGIPQIGCNCEVCRSTDRRDKRLRTSALIEMPAGTILIDCGPDFRGQILSADPSSISALLITHSHYDHIGGLDDLRPFCRPEAPFPIYAQEDVIERIRVLMPYTFGSSRYPGAPSFEFHVIKAGETFELFGAEILPLKVWHTPNLPILGYRIGNLGYVTDCKTLPSESLKLLNGIDLLVINALRHSEHPSHMNLSEALNVISNVGPKRAYLTHLSHEMGFHNVTDAKLPNSTRVAFDGLTITC